MPHGPLQLVVLDVNETLFPLDPVAERMAAVGLDGQLELWFTRILRDGFAAAAAGGFAGFRDLAAHHLRELLRARDGTADDDHVEHVLAGFQEVVPHPDVPAGLRRLAEVGVPAVTLTNGSTAIARGFLERAGLAELVEELHDVTESGRWKPAAEPYLELLRERAVPPGAAAVVASHPWDLFGAASAGLRTGWLDRDGAGSYPAAFGAPDVRAATLQGVVDGLVDLAV